MKDEKRLRAKIQFMLSALAFGGLGGFIINAVCFYLVNKDMDLTVGSIATFAAVSSLAFSLIAGVAFGYFADSEIRVRNLPLGTYRKEQHMLINFFPENLLLQVVCACILVSLKFLVVSAGVAQLMFGARDASLLLASVVDGIIVALAIVNTAYYMMAARCASQEMIARRRTLSEKRGARKAAEAEERPAKKARPVIVIPVEQEGAEEEAEEIVKPVKKAAKPERPERPAKAAKPAKAERPEKTAKPVKKAAKPRPAAAVEDMDEEELPVIEQAIEAVDDELEMEEEIAKPVKKAAKKEKKEEGATRKFNLKDVRKAYSFSMDEEDLDDDDDDLDRAVSGDDDEDNDDDFMEEMEIGKKGGKKAEGKRGSDIRMPEFLKPQSKNKTKLTMDDIVPNEAPAYSPNAKTGVLPDMAALGLDFEDFDDLDEE